MRAEADMARGPVGAAIRAPAFEAVDLSESHVLSITNYPLWRNRPAFFDGNIALGTEMLPGNGVVHFISSALSIGNHPITAVYNGDGGHFSPSTSAVHSQIVMSSQSIAFGSIADHLVGASPFLLSA